jgi:hypothetical protein
MLDPRKKTYPLTFLRQFSEVFELELSPWRHSIVIGAHSTNKRFFWSELRDCLSNIGNRPSRLGEICGVSSAAIVLLHPVFDGIYCVSTCLIGFHQLPMNSLGTFPLPVEMKDHGQTFGQLLVIVFPVLGIIVQLHKTLKGNSPTS